MIPSIFIEVEICAQFPISSFTDGATGDFWNDGLPKPALGVEYTVTDDFSVITDNLDDTTGCDRRFLRFELLGSRTYDVTFTPNAVVNEVPLESYQLNSSPRDITNVTQVPVMFLGVQAASSFPIQSDLYTLPVQRDWLNLGVGTHMFSRSDFHLWEGASRECCSDYVVETLRLPPRGNWDGSCDPGYGDDAYVGPPVKFVADSDSNFSGGESRIADGAGGTVPVIHTTQAASTFKFLIAHEVGHVVTHLRMGDGSNEQTDNTAPLDGCSGDHDDVAGHPLLDPGNGNRGELTKEYASTAAYEGWADFVAAWAWNDRTQSDCQFDLWTLHDFDLDGDMDNIFVNRPQLRGVLDCSGSPEWVQAKPTDPTASYVGSLNWLQDLEDAADPAGCSVAAGAEENRTTVYDWMKLFWDLTAVGHGDIDIETLTDLHIDMCPRGWAENDAILHPDEWPIERLKISADHHAVRPELDAWIGNIER